MTLRNFVWLGLASTCALAQTIAVGGGTTTTIQATFQTAYQRNGFDKLVSAPISNVTAFGATGLIQTFPGATNTSFTFALVKPDTTATSNVVQVYESMYYFYSVVGVTAAGYPLADTALCPVLISAANAGNSCTWQQFGNNYALFAFTQPLAGADQTLGTYSALADPYFTQWNNLGGITGLGPATSQLTQITSSYGSKASMFRFDQGAMYNITAGLSTGQLLTVKEPVFDIYTANGAETGAMGLPVGSELLLTGGMRQQDFERGAISYSPTTLVAALLPPVASVAIIQGAVVSQSPSIQMYPGQSLAAQANLLAANGAALVSRPVVWSTSNSKVVQVEGTGSAVTLLAIGAGTASVTALAEGQTSPPLSVSVTASYCCLVGEGAPTAAIQQAFQNAVARNGLIVQLPAASGVVRLGNGYVQQLMSAGTPSIAYLAAVADSTSSGYIVSGAILAQYLQLGGPAGPLGYPLSDATAGGRQTFQYGALAGSPLQLVTGAILTKWQSLGYETGAAGPPTTAASAFVTFAGTPGNLQSFQNGEIVATTGGSHSGQAYFVTTPALAKYNAGGGPGGNLGAPIDDAHLVNAQSQQDFEDGYISYPPGSSQAVEVDTPRQPLITATPGVVRAGTSVHLVLGGFGNGASLRVSQNGQADFLVTTPGGSYTWDVWVPASTLPGQVTVKASAVSGAPAAQSSYTVYTAAPGSMTVSVVSGDQQTGAPGAMLPQPLIVVVKDQDGSPVAGQNVAFAASSGAQVAPASAATNAAGQASAMLRLPQAAGVALATAGVGLAFATFSAKSAAYSLTNFPALSQAVTGVLGNSGGSIQNQGALLTAAASILRFYQLRGALPQPNGLADPVSLNQFLTSFCTADSQGNQLCDGFVALGSAAAQTVNLWRLGSFVSNSLDVQVQPATVNAVRDLVAAGSPVLLALSLGGLGSHFVVATGIAPDGSLSIADPNPAFAQTNLNGYLTGFTAGSQTVQGALTGSVLLLPQAPVSPGFVVASTAPVAISSAAGPCGQTLQFPAVAAVAGAVLPQQPGALYFAACESSAGLYELDVAGSGAYNLAVTDLSQQGGRAAVSGTAPAASEVTLNANHWTVAPLTSMIAGTVLNAASFTSDVAPGGFISIFGAGLSGAGATTVQINGQAAPVVSATPFQVNAQIPAAISPGAAQLVISSGNGSAQQSFVVKSVAPAIFSLTASQAAITNQDNSINTPSNPARRGSAVVIYCTGFGAVTAGGVASAPVSVVIGGLEIPAAYAGSSGGTPGLNQANVILPATLPPGLALPLYLKQNGAVSNTVTVAVQ